MDSANAKRVEFILFWINLCNFIGQQSKKYNYEIYIIRNIFFGFIIFLW